MRTWAKLLPYWFVMWFTKQFTADNIKFNGKDVRGWRIDKGEWIVWHQENYDIMRKKEREREQEKVSKRRAKFEELKEEFEPEVEDND